MQNAYQSLVAAMGVAPLSKFRVADVSQRDALGQHGAVGGTHRRRRALAPARRAGRHAAEKASAAGIRAAKPTSSRRSSFPRPAPTTRGGSGSFDPSVGDVPPTFNVSATSGTHGAVRPGRAAATRAARLALRQARRSRQGAGDVERIREEAVHEIVTAQTAVETSLAAHEASKALETAARTTYDAAFDAYRHSVGTVTAVTVAATQLLQATDATTDTYNGALAAAASLAFATGSLGSAPGPLSRALRPERRTRSRRRARS
jgi:outer membrane protein TolC